MWRLEHRQSVEHAESWRGPWMKAACGLAMIAALAFCGRNYLREIGRLRQASPVPVIAVLLVYLINRSLDGEGLRIALVQLGHPINRFEAFLMSILGAYANLVFPRGGLGAPAMYLKLRYGVGYTDFTSLVLFTSLLQVLATSASGLLSLAAAKAMGGTPLNLGVACVFTASLVAGILVMLVRIKVPDSWHARVVGFVRRLNGSLRLLGESKTLVLRTVVLQVLCVLLRTVRLQLAFFALGQEVNFSGTLVSSTLADLALFVSVTPASLGIREGIVAYGATMMGTTPSMAVAAALLDRLIWTLAVIAMAQFGVWRLVPRACARHPAN